MAPASAAPRARGGARALGRHGSAIIAAVVYLALALWAVRAVLPAPASTFAFPAYLRHTKWHLLVQKDQKLTAALVTHHARALLADPRSLLDGPQCYPARHAITLGEHMYGAGLLGVVPYALTGDPVLTYNAVTVLALWIPALAMYALVSSWTGSAGAAFVAGLLFGLHPARIADLMHLYARANQWTPLALLAAQRFFVRRRWWDAAALALCCGLQLLESIYPLLAFAILGGSFGIFLLVRHGRALPALAPKLLAAGAAVVGIAAAVLGPYLATRATWGAFVGHEVVLRAWRDFAIGGGAYLGTVLLLLAGVGLLDRLRGPRRRCGDDPRLALLAAAVLVAWMAVVAVPIPFLDVEVPSLYRLAGRVLPGLDTLRGGGAIGFGLVFVGALFAGYGTLAVIEGRPRVVRAAVTAAIAAAACAEVFQPRLAARSFGRSLAMEAYDVRPSPALVELYRKSGTGAVLDLPFGFTQGRFFEMADDVFLTAFHHRPTAACYNSFHLPIQDEVERLALRLGKDDAAVHALHALGFGSALVHQLRAFGRGGRNVRVIPRPPLLVEAGRAPMVEAYGLTSPLPIEASLRPLAAGASARSVPDTQPPSATLQLSLRNASTATYRHPFPIEPTPLVVRWQGDAGALRREDVVAVLLPLALAPGESAARAITVPVPPTAGDYRVTVAPAAQPALVLDTLLVRVRPDAGIGVPRS